MKTNLLVMDGKSRDWADMQALFSEPPFGFGEKSAALVGNARQSTNRVEQVVPDKQQTTRKGAGGSRTPAPALFDWFDLVLGVFAVIAVALAIWRP